MPVIRVDDEVWKYLQQRARPFVDTPNDVLRRILQLSEASHNEGLNDAVNKDLDMKNIRTAALLWLRNQLENPDSPLSGFLVQQGYSLDFDFLKKSVASSKYFETGESFPGIPSWWSQIPLGKVSESDKLFTHELLLCQKTKGNGLDFWCLAVPFAYLQSEYATGNLGTLGNNICLHLSAEDCVYRGYDVKMFDDVRLTMLNGHRPIPFGQFLI